MISLLKGQKWDGRTVSTKSCPAELVGFIADNNTEKIDRLERLRAHVSPDGESTTFTVKYANREELKVCIPIEQIASVYAEVRYAANAMLARQSQVYDQGARKLLEMIELAASPAEMSVMIDPTNNDRLAIFQFKTQAPIVLRMTAQETRELARKISCSYH